MGRKEDLLKIVGDNEIFVKLIDEVVYIEEQLVELKKYPFIKINPNNPNQQKSTAAAKLYKEFLQQYNNSLKILAKATGQDENDEESPLRKWAREFANKGAENMDT